MSKSYGSTHALSDATLTVDSGEIHGLLGQNGSGKSTLIKILAGVVAADSGTMRLRGDDVPLPQTAAEAERLGLRFVHQHLGLVETLTVGENLLLQRFADGHHPIRWRSLFDEAEQALGLYGLKVDPRATIGALSPLERAQVAIARALAPLSGDGESRQAVLVLDEPTVYLPKKEVGFLFELLDRVVADGHGVLLVTHRLSELLDHTSRVSILRDARIVATRQTSATNEDDMVELAVGTGWRDEEAAIPMVADGTDVGSRAPDVVVRGLHTKHLRNMELRLRPGRILGFTGLAESGYDEALYALFGAADRVAGQVEMGERRIDLARLTPAAAIAEGIALVPVDRLAQGVAGSASIEESLTLPALRRYFRGGRLRLAEATASSRAAIARYGVVATGPSARVDTLSGGNQQKVLVAKWLQRQPALLLLHEPTQGVDVRARHDIWRYIRDAAAQCPVLVASSDYDELAELCTEVAIVADGIVRKTLSGDRLTADAIAAECLKRPGNGTTRNEGDAA